MSRSEEASDTTSAQRPRSLTPAAPKPGASVTRPSKARVVRAASVQISPDFVNHDGTINKALMRSARPPSRAWNSSSLEDRMFFRWGGLSSVLLRYALGLGFLSAVADRFGLWGAFGQPNVEWGDFSRFLDYTHSLNWYVPAGMVPVLGVIATGAETLFGLLLLAGWHTRATALLSGLLLLSFGVAMTVALGIKAPLNFAVFTGVGGALLLANCESFPFTVDQLLFGRTHSEEGR